MNYNSTKKTVQIIEKEIKNISDSCCKNNKNIDNISEKVDNIEKNINKLNGDFFYMNLELKNLSAFLNIHFTSQKKGIEKSTSIDPFEFLTLEDICGANYKENYEEKSTQTEENIILKKEELENNSTNNKNSENNFEHDDIMNECYDIIPCNNIKKYVNNKYNLFF
jgi:hypothetical protein